jgi:hypothetical protein
MNGAQLFLVGAAVMLFVIAFTQPPDRPVPNFVWAVIGVTLIVVVMLPTALLLAILGLAFFVMFRSLRRY